ncbi:MAG: hypothetical protein R3E01_08910 [Pirellulaceae bacterium]|nr:hypothetical protein [Planctomycetales bacterium]
MADKFDAYREALVVETNTIWPGEYDALDTQVKLRIATALHSEPDQVSHLEYVRMHTGFCRQITVTPEDMARLGG